MNFKPSAMRRVLPGLISQRNSWIKFLQRHPQDLPLGELTPEEKGRRTIQAFLNQHNALKTFNQKQRIVLIASAFDPQTLSAVAWLIANQVDITCLSLLPIEMENQLFLQIKKELPPVGLDEHYLDIYESKPGTSIQTGKKGDSVRNYYPRMNKLLEWGIVKPGDPLIIRNYEDSRAEILDDKYVKYQGEKLKYNEWGQKVTGWSSIQIYVWAKPVGSDKTLHDLRMERLEAAD